MSSDYALKLLRSMLELYSPSGKEGEVASLLKGEMEIGYRAQVDGVGNVIGAIKGSSEGPEVLLCGHMDTVPGFIPVKEVNGNLYGRGLLTLNRP
ncbi:MAG: hypothetical protein QXK12_00855 [Candidatus Nezhaarchaeales archaeon]